MWLPAAGTLAACADDGGSEDEPAARGPLALRELLGPLARLLARLEGALQAVRSVVGARPGRARSVSRRRVDRAVCAQAGRGDVLAGAALGGPLHGAGRAAAGGRGLRRGRPGARRPRAPLPGAVQVRGGARSRFSLESLAALTILIQSYSPLSRYRYGFFCSFETTY